MLRRLAFVLLVTVPLALFLGWLVLRDTESFREAHFAPDVLRVKVTSVPHRWSECRVDVVEILKGKVRPGGALHLWICCDFDPAPGDELVIMTDATRTRIWLCGKEGGWPALRRCTAGSVPWNDADSIGVPLWLWKRFIPRGTARRPELPGG